MSIRNRMAALAASLLLAVITSGCQGHGKSAEPTAKQEPSAAKAPTPESFANVAATADLAVANKAVDAFFKSVSTQGDAVTPERVKTYAQERLTELLKHAGLAVDVKGTLKFSIGVEGDMLKDPIEDPKGNLLEIGGQMELPAPHIQADFRASEQGKELFAAPFSGGDWHGSKDWKGVQGVIDMSIGHLLKDFAIHGKQATPVVAILTSEQLIPRDPYIHAETNFGKIRIHQDGNLWEALSQIGEPSRNALEEAARDKDPEISAEAKLGLEKLKKP